MALRYRPMQQKDVLECVRIVAEHPVIGTRYGNIIKQLGPAWLRLLGCDAITTAVFEEVDDAHITIVGVGVGVFVSDRFIHELKTEPLFWFGPELAKRVMAGKSPVLTDREVREANSRDGLNELVWENFTSPHFAVRSDLYHLMGNAYIDVHRGFRFKEMITSQAESPERLQWAVDAGGLYWNPVRQRYTKSLERSASEFIRVPHIVGITREIELSRPGSWVGILFNYHPPRFGFCPSEQRLLRAALGSDSGTDQELAKALKVSLPTVKKTWLSLYARVAERAPKMIPDYSRTHYGPVERGKEKRRRLLAYLREHPEELRPIPRERLQHSPGRRLGR